MSTAAKEKACLLNPLMSHVLMDHIVSSKGLIRQKDSHAKNNEQTDREEEREGLGVLFTPIKLPELICNCRLVQLYRFQSASRVPSRDVENEQDKPI